MNSERSFWKEMTFDLDGLILELENFPNPYRIAFTASCCERLLPNYQAFVVMEQWGDFSLLRKALNEVWKVLEGENLSSDYLLDLSRQCENVAPDTEDFSSVFTSAALDAASGVALALQCCIDGGASKAAEVGSLARDTIDMYIQVRDCLDYSDPAFEEKIQNDPLMLAELGKQAADLKALASMSELTSEFLENLRRSSESLGLQSQLRGIEK